MQRHVSRRDKLVERLDQKETVHCSDLKIHSYQWLTDLCHMVGALAPNLAYKRLNPWPFVFTLKPWVIMHDPDLGLTGHRFCTRWPLVVDLLVRSSTFGDAPDLHPSSIGHLDGKVTIRDPREARYDDQRSPGTSAMMLIAGFATARRLRPHKGQPSAEK